MAPFNNLKAWEHAHQLAVDCSRLARHFPEYERFGLADQLRRAGYSIPINIAEGSARRGPREFRRFLDVARASLAEAETILSISKDLGYIHKDDYARVEALAVETGKTLYGLLRKVSANAAGKGK
jgi:four helix bundle protein